MLMWSYQWMEQLSTPLKEINQKIADLIELEKARQWKGIELIPSETFTSVYVLPAVGSVMNHNSEGLPGARYHGGKKEYFEDVDRTWETFDKKLWGHIYNFFKHAKERPLDEDKLDDVHATKNSFSGTDSSVSIYPEWDEFWNYLSTPEVIPVQDAPPSKADEDNKIRALIDTPALDWQCHNPDSIGAGRGFGHGRGGRSDGRGFGRGGLLERITPPPGYICHRCTVPAGIIGSISVFLDGGLNQQRMGVCNRTSAI